MSELNQWDQRFSNVSGFMYGEQPNVWIATQLPVLSKGSKVLALADGEGRNSVWLARQGYRVSNWDYSAVGLEKTQFLAQSANVEVETVLLDLIQDALPEQEFDAVVASFFHVPKAFQLQCWRKVFSRMKPASSLVVQVFDESQLPLSSGGPKSIDLLYDLATWQTLLRDWQVESCCLDQVDLDEGSHHQGLAQVINIKAVKPV